MEIRMSSPEQKNYKRRLASIFFSLGHRFLNWSQRLYISPEAVRVIPWFEAEGDKSYRLNYELNESSTVIDLGGYEGQWASDIFSKFSCSIWIFEVHPLFVGKIQERFKKNSKIKVFPFGLGGKTEKEFLIMDKDSSSTHKRTGNKTEISIIQASQFFKEHNFPMIDLMKVNIEGGEYDLLDHLLDFDLIKNIQNIQVQFHDFVPNALQRMTKIQNRLSQSHSLTFQFPFVWENWSKKQAKKPDNFRPHSPQNEFRRSK